MRASEGALFDRLPSDLAELVRESAKRIRQFGTGWAGYEGAKRTIERRAATSEQAAIAVRLLAELANL